MSIITLDETDQHYSYDSLPQFARGESPCGRNNLDDICELYNLKKEELTEDMINELYCHTDADTEVITRVVEKYWRGLWLVQYVDDGNCGYIDIFKVKLPVIMMTGEIKFMGQEHRNLFMDAIFPDRQAGESPGSFYNPDGRCCAVFCDSLTINYWETHAILGKVAGDKKGTELDGFKFLGMSDIWIWENEDGDCIYATPYYEEDNHLPVELHLANGKTGLFESYELPADKTEFTWELYVELLTKALKGVTQ